MLRKKINRVLSLLLLIAVLSYTANSVIYKHAHVYNGSVIEHAHPFAQDNDTNNTTKHTHTAGEFALLSFTNAITILFAIIISLISLSLSVNRLQIPRISFLPEKAFYSYNAKRGPPSLA